MGVVVFVGGGTERVVVGERVRGVRLTVVEGVRVCVTVVGVGVAVVVRVDVRVVVVVYVCVDVSL